MLGEAVYHSFEGATYDIPSFKTIFPKINIQLCDKLHPGLQVVDFLLWAVGRSRKIKPENTWKDRLCFKNYHYYETENKFFRGQYFLNHFQDLQLNVNYDIQFQKPETWEECINAYILIERFIRQMDVEDFSESNLHLWDDFVIMSTLLKNNSYYLKMEGIVWIGKIFLRMFDSIPLYKDVKTPEEWKQMFHAKYLASMLVRNDKLHFNRTKDEILRWRYKVQKESFHYFV